MVLVRPPVGLSRLCGCSAGSLPTRKNPPRMRIKSFAVTASLYYAWPSFFPGVNAVLPPLVAAEGVAITGFFAFDAVGSFLWSGFYAGLGYLFSNELDVAFGWAKHFGTALGMAIGVPIGLYAGWRGLTLLRMVRRLRLRRISPAMLALQTEIQEQGRSARPVGLRR